MPWFPDCLFSRAVAVGILFLFHFQENPPSGTGMPQGDPVLGGT